MKKLATKLLFSGNPIGIAIGVTSLLATAVIGYATGYDQSNEECEEILMQLTTAVEKQSAEVDEVTRENVYLKRENTQLRQRYAK